MKAKLIEALLSSRHGDAVRHGLHLEGQRVYCEVLHFTVRPVPNRELACDLRVQVAKWGNGDEATLSGDSVELEIEFSGVVGISYAHDDQHKALDGPDCPLDIDIEDRFRICCQRFEVKKVRAFNLADEPR
jgi:hypothetical protein